MATEDETTSRPLRRWGQAYVAAPWQVVRPAFATSVWASLEHKLRMAVEAAGATYDPEQVRRTTVTYKPDEHGALAECPEGDPDRTEIHFRVKVVTP